MSVADDTSQAAWNVLAGQPQPIHIGPEDGSRTVLLQITDCNGPNWFPMRFGCGRFEQTIHLRRSELRAIRDRLDEIDRAHPDPSERHRRTDTAEVAR